jgi:hypothetical protein
MNALALLLTTALLAFAPAAAAQTRSEAPAVTVTLVRWPYT